MERVDCIVVGGGLAGLTAAYGLASEGLDVLVLERGNYCGAKNVTGGRLYTSVLRGVFPELWADAPFERPVTREFISMMADGRLATFAIGADAFAAPNAQSYTVIRARLDRYLADRVTEAGGMVIANMKADALLKQGDRIVGVRAGEDEIGADVTVIAEGVLGLLSTEAGLRQKPAAVNHALGYKEIIELPATVIEDRWQLTEGEGAAHLFVGDVTKGMMGGGFLYTYRDSISLGVVTGMEQIRSRRDGLESWQLLDEFKASPHIAPLVRGGVVTEYSAHAIAEGGIAQVPRLFGNGYVMAGEAAGLSLNMLITVRGMDLAIASGFHAAKTIVEARRLGDSSASTLASYGGRLRDSFVLKDLRTAAEAPRVMDNARLYSHYPKAITELMTAAFTVGPDPAKKLSSTVFGGLRRYFLDVATAKDAMSLRKI